MKNVSEYRKNIILQTQSTKPLFNLELSRGFVDCGFIVCFCLTTALLGGCDMCTDFKDIFYIKSAIVSENSVGLSRLRPAMRRADA